jgi:hypothetical protein
MSERKEEFTSEETAPPPLSQPLKSKRYGTSGNTGSVTVVGSATNWTYSTLGVIKMNGLYEQKLRITA